MATQHPPALAETGLSQEPPVLECRAIKYYDAQDPNCFHPVNEAALAPLADWKRVLLMLKF